VLLIFAIAVAGCSKRAERAAATAPFVHAIMYSTLIADVSDPEWKQKLDAMKAAGIDAVSAVLTIRREKFPCEYPFASTGANGQPGATYLLDRPNPRYWAHFRAVVDHCNALGMTLVVSIGNHPSARHGEHLCYGPSHSTAALDNPSPYWQQVYAQLIRWTAAEMDRCKSGGILPVLEGSSKNTDLAVRSYYEKVAHPAGALYWITNTGAAGMINSPHLHSTSAIMGARGGVMVSTDGWYSETPGDIAKWVPARRAKGDAAAEDWCNGLLAGYFDLSQSGERCSGQQPYERRKRPTLAQCRGEIARLVTAFGRY
jgi:hypothetical protein